MHVDFPVRFSIVHPTIILIPADAFMRLYTNNK